MTDSIETTMFEGAGLPAPFVIFEEEPGRLKAFTYYCVNGRVKKFGLLTVFAPDSPEYVIELHKDLATCSIYRAILSRLGLYNLHNEQKPRQAVQNFALAMEAKLAEHDAEWGGNSWPTATPTELGDALVARAGKVEELIFEVLDTSLSRQLLAKECVNLANYCMMIYDNLNNSQESEV